MRDEEPLMNVLRIDAQKALCDTTPLFYGACIEDVNHELYGGIWSQLIFGEAFQEPPKSPSADESRPLAEIGGVSGAWSVFREAGTIGKATLFSGNAFQRAQSQRIVNSTGGRFGLYNLGLNGKGIGCQKDRPYEGYIYMKADRPIKVCLSMESADGCVYAQTELIVDGENWKKYPFELFSKGYDPASRFTIFIRDKGTLDIGYAFLQPGAWGRYKNLPVRRDVAEMLVLQGIKVLRMGGCMVNRPNRARENNAWKNTEWLDGTGYWWKNMIAEPEFRPNYKGWWYQESSLGFGIFEFLELTEAMGIMGIPAFCGEESPEDMANFIDYALGTDPSNVWTRKRIESGRQRPYNVPYIQYGNEERVDEEYAQRFNRVTNAVFAKNQNVTLIVGDFLYEHVITDPFEFTGSPAITSLIGQKMILENAAQIGKEVWFDMHFWSEKIPQPRSYFLSADSFVKRLRELVPAARFKLVILELNANSHDVNRALANAYAINKLQRNSDIYRMVCSANCLQVDKNNDNGWDQGLVFLNSEEVWMQPPGYVTKMASDTHLPVILEAGNSFPNEDIDVTVLSSQDRSHFTIRIVNMSGEAERCRIEIPEIRDNRHVDIMELQGCLDACNSVDAPHQVIPIGKQYANGFRNGKVEYTILPYSYTVIKL